MTLPPLVTFGAQALVPPPYRCTETKLWAFVADADEQRLRQLCARVFVTATAGAVSCEPLGRHVVLTFGRIGSITSLAPGYATDGTIAEGQACVWVLVLVDGRLAVFVPYLVVDNPMSLVAGREVFGYPKSSGWIDLPGDARGAPEEIAVDVYGGMFGPDQTRGRRPLMRVRRADAIVPEPAPVDAGHDLERALGHLVSVAGLHLATAAADSSGSALARVRQVFLKQIPDISGTGAALQQVGEAPLAIERFRGHPLIHRWELTVDVLDSHPVVAELGLSSQTLYGGFVVDELDFVLEPGTVVWPPAPVSPTLNAGDQAAVVDAARQRVDAVRDDPEGRYALARELYEDRAVAAGGAAYGRGELAFLRWEIDRGVLDAASGSPWWRAVNLDLLADGAEAAALADAATLGAPATSDRREIAAWLAFFRDPSPTSWYRAHNTSIVAGYLRHAELAGREEAAEIVLVNHVLARVLFAQLLAADPARALGALDGLAPFLGDPRTDAVGAVVDLPDLYPRHYPLTRHDRRRVEQKDRSPVAIVGDIVDDDVVGRQLGSLYTWAAAEFDQPRLRDLTRDGVSDYPWPLLPPADVSGPEPRVRRPSEVVRLLRGLADAVLG